MTDDPRSRLIALLTRLGAVDLAGQLWAVRDVRELTVDVRGAICSVIGHEAAERGLDANDSPNDYGRQAGRAHRGARVGQAERAP
jgi:hypothetical protein